VVATEETDRVVEDLVDAPVLNVASDLSVKQPMSHRLRRYALLAAIAATYLFANPIHNLIDQKVSRNDYFY
jgi:hypothetical protein